MKGHFALAAFKASPGMHEFGDCWPDINEDMLADIFGTLQANMFAMGSTLRELPLRCTLPRRRPLVD